MEKLTKEQISEIVAIYSASPTKETIAALVLTYDRSTRSVTALLSRAGVYKKPEYRTKTGEQPHTKESLIEVLAGLMRCESCSLEGLEKAPKSVIRKIILALDGTALDYLK